MALMATLAASAAAEAQTRGEYWGEDPYRRGASNPRVALGIHLMGADAIGEFGQVVDGGFGLQLDGRFGIDRASILAIRVDGGFMIYGWERQQLCFPVPIGCRVGADLTTTNNVLYAGIGPEIAVPGRISPYVYGTFGFSWFNTRSSLSGTNAFDNDPLFDTRNFSDLVGSLRAGGGLRFQVAGRDGGTPISIDLGADYHRNGVTEYLREGDILDNPDGSITLFPNRSEANYLSFRAGVQIGFGGGG
jgi:hypothetical protein